MKTPLILIAMMFGTTAFARIGETTEQLAKRYGHPVEKSRDNGESHLYSFRGFTIVVGLDHGISQCEVYQKVDRSRMSEAEIRGLLDANVSNSAWRDEPEESFSDYVYWSRDKKTRVGIYHLATHTLLVTSKPFLARFSSLVHSNDRKRIEGF